MNAPVFRKAWGLACGWLLEEPRSHHLALPWQAFLCLMPRLGLAVLVLVERLQKEGALTHGLVSFMCDQSERQ